MLPSYLPLGTPSGRFQRGILIKILYHLLIRYMSDIRCRVKNCSSEKFGVTKFFETQARAINFPSKHRKYAEDNFTTFSPTYSSFTNTVNAVYCYLTNY
jgi:hypothetical protein